MKSSLVAIAFALTCGERVERDRAQIRATRQRLQTNIDKVKDAQKKEAEAKKPLKPRPPVPEAK